MDESEFRKLYHCEFKAEPEYAKLLDRLNLYYEQTPDSIPNQIAIKYWRDFKKWCDCHGYTSEDINRAKRSLSK